MAKLPFYLKTKGIQHKNNKLIMTIKLKAIGVPILIYNVLKNNYRLKWYQFLYYYPLFVIYFFISNKEGD